MTILHLQLGERVIVVPTDTSSPDPAFLDQNPLGKIPTLVLDDGTTLFDSSVIAAYLDELAGGGRIVPSGPARIPALRFEALADGILDAIVLIVYERRWRAERNRELSWIAHQQGKVSRGLAEAERLVTAEELPHIGHFALAAALGYLDLRFEGEWRRERPGLVRWLSHFAHTVPAFEATRPVETPR